MSRFRPREMLTEQIRSWIFGSLALSLFGCSVPTPTPMPSDQATATVSTATGEINQALSLAAAQSASSSANYRIGPDDLVQVTVYNIPDQDARVTPRTVILRVSQEGVIVLPLIGEVSVKGQTTGEVEQELKTRYAKYIRTPQVGVLVTEYRQRVSVMGAVQKPGVFDLMGPLTVIDMVAQAGGITDKAGNQVFLFRKEPNGKRETAVIDLMVLANPSGQITDSKDAAMVNLPMKAGDVINVPQAGMFFVDGAIRRPGSYPLSRSYTLTQALATAGGADPELADYGSIAIFRRHGPTNVETITVDLDNVMAQKTADPKVQPDDVIVVPMSSLKYFVKRFVGTILSGTSAPAIR
jgi:polysaccharide biosynthesis/export protein